MKPDALEAIILSLVSKKARSIGEVQIAHKKATGKVLSTGDVQIAFDRLERRELVSREKVPCRISYRMVYAITAEGAKMLRRPGACPPEPVRGR